MVEAEFEKCLATFYGELEGGWWGLGEPGLPVKVFILPVWVFLDDSSSLIFSFLPLFHRVIRYCSGLQDL